MTFFRRHWPDVVISLLIVVLLLGFAFVLLGDGMRGSKAGSGVTPPGQVQNGEVQSAPPQANDQANQATTQPATTQPATTQPATTQPATTQPATPDPAAPEDLPTIAGTGDAPAAGPTVVVTPSAGVPSEQAPGAVPSATTDTATTDQTPTTPAPSSPVPTSSSDTPTRANYRLSVGVFTSGARARASTQAVADLGYTVHIIPIASGVVAQIGPFADRDSAARAQADIQRVFENVVLYAPVNRPKVDGTDNTKSGATAGQDATPATQKTAPQPSAPALASYLQVGAFTRQTSAAPLVEKLRAQGFSPTVNAPPGKTVRVLVGPYGAADIKAAERKLSGMGLDHFRVR